MPQWRKYSSTHLGPSWRINLGDPVNFPYESMCKPWRVHQLISRGGNKDNENQG